MCIRDRSLYSDLVKRHGKEHFHQAIYDVTLAFGGLLGFTDFVHKADFLRSNCNIFIIIAVSYTHLDVYKRQAVRYLPERKLPDKAIDLLDEACSAARISQKPESRVTAEVIQAVVSLSLIHI